MNTLTLKVILTQSLPVVFMAAAGVLLILFWVRYFAPATPDQSTKTAPASIGTVALFVASWFAVSRLMILAVSVIAMGGAAFDFEVWTRWDADHYLGLAEHWYQNEGDPRLHIVFYPLYPLAVRALKTLLMGHTALAAYLISNACLIGSGYALFRLVAIDQGEPAAQRAVRYLMLCPVSLFFSLPYSESLFLMLALLSVLMARRGQMLLAILFGALASSARMLGLLCAVPVFYEYFRRSRSDWRGIARGFACTCLIATGFFAYLLLNKMITGDWFRFLTYQREHWSQQFGSLGNSVKYTIQNAFSPSSEGARYGIWLPQIVAMTAVLTLMITTARRQHPADAAYALLYYYIALAPTWLLSGPRYLGALYALYPMLSLITRRKWQDAALTSALILGTIYCTYQYAFAGTMF